MENEEPILFFDGHCNLCNSFIDFLVRNDPAKKIKIASLQGETSQKYLSSTQIESMQSVVLLKKGQIYNKSAAIFRVAKQVRGTFLWLLPFSVIPRIVADWVYDRVAANRIRWFGRRETCRIPTEEEKSHFLP